MKLILICRGSPLPASKEEDTRNSESGNQDSVLALTEANLWMKSVIDAVHEDIQNRNRSKRVEIDAQSVSSSCQTARGSIPWYLTNLHLFQANGSVLVEMQKLTTWQKE